MEERAAMEVREELVQTWSQDGFQLAGVLFQPTGATPRPVAVICLPGLYATFYDSPYVALGRALAERGYVVITGHDRGHNFGAVLRRADGSLEPGGGGWERLGDCLHDIAAWLDYAAER